MIKCIIQARMSSERLPGKILRPLAGIPLLLRVVNRVKQSNLCGSVIVATSDEVSDDPVEALCSKNKIHFFRGNLNNVASRFKSIVEAEKECEGFARISADSPFIDPAVINLALEAFMKNDCDMVTNTLRRTFPKGQSVQIISKNVFLKGYPRFTKEEQEHVLLHFQKYAKDYRVYNFECESENMEEIDMSLNEPGDFELAEKVIEKMDMNIDAASWEEIVKAYKQVKVHA